MGDSDESEKLQTSLRKLMQNYGVREDNLRLVLTPDLIGDFRIKRHDSPQRVQDKVKGLLEELARPLSEESQKIARYSFNITGLPKIESIATLGGRQKALHDSGGSAVRTSQDEITKAILPNFAEQLLARRRKRKLVLITGGAGAAVTLAAVIVLTVILTSGGDGNKNNTGGGGGQTQGPGSVAQGITLVFDALGGRPPIIQVYPGVTDSPADKQVNGTFNDGDTVTVLCKTKGRTVSWSKGRLSYATPPGRSWWADRCMRGLQAEKTRAPDGNGQPAVRSARTLLT